MSAEKASSESRIALDEVIASAGQGALRALNARQQAATLTNGFFVDVVIRCGFPPVLQNANPVELGRAAERGGASG